jgi:hypothetical protein
VKRRLHYGITIFETLVVCSIIMIAAAILYGVIKRVKYNAKVATCSGRLSQLATALGSYIADNDDFFPPWPTQSTYLAGTKLRPRPKALVGAPEKWKSCLVERGASEECFWCPLDPHRNTDFVAEQDGHDDHRQRFTSYQTNYGLQTEKLVDGKGHILARHSMIKDPATLPYLGEHTWDPDGDPEHPKLVTSHGDLGYCIYFDLHVELSPGSKITKQKAD